MQKRQCAGFTYLALLFFVAIMGLTLSLTGVLWSKARQREKEAELLFVGAEFRRAIGSYYESTPGTVKRYPLSLDDLLSDGRFVINMRHLRRIYRDPMTLSTEWNVIRAPDGGIMGVHSTSNDDVHNQVAYKQDGDGRGTARTYSHWHFIYVPPSVAASSNLPKIVTKSDR